MYRAAALACLLGATVEGFYLPGIAPHEYEDGDAVREAFFSKPLAALLFQHLFVVICRRPPADYVEGQQDHVDEDLAAVRILPPTVLQARCGALPEGHPPEPQPQV